MKKNNKKEERFYVIPQTEAEIERNRKIIEELRARGLLQKYEKTFKITKEGTIVGDD